MSGLCGGRFERAFLDVRVFNPFVVSNSSSSLYDTYSGHDKAKRRRYEQRVSAVQQPSFVPVVLSCTGGQGKAASALNTRKTEKTGEPFSVILAKMRCRLSFALLRAACIRLRR